MYSTPQKTLQTLIESFGLAIRLRVVRRAHEQLCVRQLEKLLPNMASGVPDGQRRATRVSVHDRLAREWPGLRMDLDIRILRTNLIF